MSKKTPETLRYPTDAEHLQAVREKLESLRYTWDFINASAQEMEETNALLIYKYLILQRLLNRDESDIRKEPNLIITQEKLKTWDVFEKYLVFGELPHVGWLNQVIDDLTFLLDQEKWREYVAGGEQLITGEPQYFDSV